MRTTLNIDDDLLADLRRMATQEGVPTGQVVSRLLRHALIGPGTVFLPFAKSPSMVVTNAQVDALRDSEGI